MKKLFYLVAFILFLMASYQECEMEMEEDRAMKELSEVHQREMEADSLNLADEDWVLYVNNQ